MRKRLFVVVMAGLLLLLLAGGGGAWGQGTWSDSIQIRNLTSNDASIRVDFYNQDGTIAHSFSDTIPGDSSVSYYPLSAPDGFNGSVVVSSSEPIVAMANHSTTDFRYLSSYEAFSEGSTSVNLPLIMRGNSGYNTTFYVQNTGTETAEVRVDYYPSQAGNSGVYETANIAPGAAHVFDQTDLTALGDRFVGSAVVSSTNGQPVAATVNELNTTIYPSLLTYSGFVGGSDTIVLPLIQHANSGFFSGIQVQNMSSATTTTITVTYGPNNVGTFSPVAETATDVGPGEGAVFNQLPGVGQWTGNVADRYVGSATVTSDPPVPLVATVNQLSPLAADVRASTYNGFDPDSATDTILAPIIQANNSGFWSSINVMNVGTAASTVTVDFGPNVCAGCTFAPADETAVLDPGGSHNFLQAGGQWGSHRYVGSAMITADGAPNGHAIVAAINQISTTRSGDTLSTYNGFNISLY